MTKLMLYLEVAGCPTTCRHCWAQGGAYAAMPLGDVAWVLDAAHAFCDARGLEFDAYPMHEVAAHPAAAEVMRLFREHVSPTLFEPLSTTGVPFAQRDDWASLLESLVNTGTTTAWLAFHGVGAEHDRQVLSPGAFEATRRGAERIRAAGLKLGCNVFLTKANIGQVDQLGETLAELGIEESFWATAGYGPQARVRRSEPLRPELDDLLPIAERVGGITAWRRAWQNLSDYTEAAHVRRAVNGEWSDPHPHDDAITLLCRPSLNLHTGTAGLRRQRHGNLRADGPETVLRRAIEHGPISNEALWFGLAEPPPIEELAVRHGDPTSRRIHFTTGSVRSLWLDRATRAIAS